MTLICERCSDLLNYHKIRMKATGKILKIELVYATTMLTMCHSRRHMKNFSSRVNIENSQISFSVYIDRYSYYSKKESERNSSISRSCSYDSVIPKKPAPYYKVNRTLTKHEGKSNNFNFLKTLT